MILMANINALSCLMRFSKLDEIKYPTNVDNAIIEADKTIFIIIDHPSFVK